MESERKGGVGEGGTTPPASTKVLLKLGKAVPLLANMMTDRSSQVVFPCIWEKEQRVH
jgi:hypothetical protein